MLFKYDILQYDMLAYDMFNGVPGFGAVCDRSVNGCAILPALRGAIFCGTG